jgi:hypothetical protein
MKSGIDGGLDAIQESGKTPVLELHDLEGNIVGTVADSESETKLTFVLQQHGIRSAHH